MIGFWFLKIRINARSVGHGTRPQGSVCAAVSVRNMTALKGSYIG